MKFQNRQKAIQKERQYAERRFGQLLEQIVTIPKGTPDEQIEAKLIELDTQWRNFCKNLLYIAHNGKDEFIKIARERAFKTIIVEA